MFNLKFGIVWTTFVSIIFIICLAVPGEQRGGDDFDLSMFIFFAIFEVIGISILVKGIKTVKKDKKTKKYGVNCYGIVRDIVETGSSSNGKSEYKALVEFLNPATSNVEKIEEIVGFDSNKYPVNSYVLCKYFEGDINIENLLSEIDVPEDVKKIIFPIQVHPVFSNFQFSSDKEYVTIDGVEYKKVNK